MRMSIAKRIACVAVVCLLLPTCSFASDIYSSIKSLSDEDILTLYEAVASEAISRGLLQPSSVRKRVMDDDETATPKPTLAPTFVPMAEIKEETVVWVSKSGKRYHTFPECSGMRTPIETTLSEAISSGRAPCKDCAYWLVEEGE